MSLQFPNARLLVYYLLIEGQSASEAIARSAGQYGLIPMEAVSEVQAGSNGSCGCLTTAKNILLKYFEGKLGRSESDSVRVDKIWQNIERSIELHKGEASACTQQHTHAADIRECARLTPIVFDYLLQQISQY